jgi:hypothetical protein
VVQAAVHCVSAVVLILGLTSSLGAQTETPDPQAQTAASPTAAAQGPSDDDRRVDPLQPDFTLIGLPTTLRVPVHRGAFRVTHRFTRPLGQGDFDDLVSDLFGLDSSALIGLEARFGLLPGLQAGLHRTNGNKTIEFFGQYSVMTQNDSRPLGIDTLVTVEGMNNFQDVYSPAVGAVISRKVGQFAALYAEPIWVGNTNFLSDAETDSDNTFVLGLAARVRVRPTVYVIGEIVPRLAGFDPGVTHGSFAIEKRSGGHSFQLNFSNSFATTMAQIARGGFDNDDWYLGFNISRKFF